MIGNNSLNVLAESIFIDKIKNKKISSKKIHNYWKSAREEAKSIITAKTIINEAPYCIIIHKIIYNIYSFIMYIANIIISLIMVYILMYIICFIYIILIHKND